MSPLRRTIARRLVQAQTEAAMLTTFNEVDMTAIMDIRKTYQERFVKKYGHKLGFMSFFLTVNVMDEGTTCKHAEFPSSRITSAARSTMNEQRVLCS